MTIKRDHHHAGSLSWCFSGQHLPQAIQMGKQESPAMWAIKYSRILLQLFLTAACVGAGTWAMLKGHRWTPLVFLVVFYAVSMLVLPRLPSPITHPITTRQVLTLLASLLRFLGFVTVLGCALGLFSFPFLSNPLSLWLLLPMLLLWAIWAWGMFWFSRWVKGKAVEADPSQVFDLGGALINRGKK